MALRLPTLAYRQAAVMPASGLLLQQFLKIWIESFRKRSVRHHPITWKR
jgi:hypothetical protein